VRALPAAPLGHLSAAAAFARALPPPWVAAAVWSGRLIFRVPHLGADRWPTSRHGVPSQAVQRTRRAAHADAAARCCTGRALAFRGKRGSLQERRAARAGSTRAGTIAAPHCWRPACPAARGGPCGETVVTHGAHRLQRCMRLPPGRPSWRRCGARRPLGRGGWIARQVDGDLARAPPGWPTWRRCGARCRAWARAARWRRCWSTACTAA